MLIMLSECSLLSLKINSGLFARIDSAKMTKRASDKQKSRFRDILAIILNQILNKNRYICKINGRGVSPKLDSKTLKTE